MHAQHDVGPYSHAELLETYAQHVQGPWRPAPRPISHLIMPWHILHDGVVELDLPLSVKVVHLIEKGLMILIHQLSRGPLPVIRESAIQTACPSRHHLPVNISNHWYL